jgi:hypothetical protein
MEVSALFWWNFWVVGQVLVAAGIVVALGLFIRWGRRKSARLVASQPTEGHRPAAGQ